MLPPFLLTLRGIPAVSALETLIVSETVTVSPVETRLTVPPLPLDATTLVSIAPVVALIGAPIEIGPDELILKVPPLPALELSLTTPPSKLIGPLRSAAPDAMLSEVRFRVSLPPSNGDCPAPTAPPLKLIPPV